MLTSTIRIQVFFTPWEVVADSKLASWRTYQGATKGSSFQSLSPSLQPTEFVNFIATDIQNYFSNFEFNTGTGPANAASLLKGTQLWIQDFLGYSRVSLMHQRRDGGSAFSAWDRGPTMVPIRKIMFPVDFSRSCVAMSPYVQRAAKLLGATVSLVHVVNPAAFGVLEAYELYERPMSEVSEDHKVLAGQKLDSFLKEEFPLVECSRILESGDAGTRIGEIARDEEFDLIIMPTHAGRFRQMLLGSTVAKVLDDAPCPVLTSKHAQTIAPRPLQHREWLCAIDLSRYAENVLRTAKRISEQARANLSLIHVVNEESQAASNTLGLEKDRPTKEMREAHERLMKIANEVGISAATRIARGAVKKALLEAAAEFDADVLIIGRTSDEESAGRLRDLTYAVAGTRLSLC